MSTEINWEEQWELNAPVFRDGVAHIPLTNGDTLRLLPGPGFGDFSHPTTQLMIEVMPSYIQDQVIFDIGCGSGILSIAAAKMGATKVYACDCDPEAVAHTKKNGQLSNQQIETQLPKSFEKPPVVLMNMITSEQAVAWKTHQCPFRALITSGILASDQDRYLAFAKDQEWDLLKLKEKDGWLSCIFKEKK